MDPWRVAELAVENAIDPDGDYHQDEARRWLDYIVGGGVFWYPYLAGAERRAGVAVHFRARPQHDK